LKKTVTDLNKEFEESKVKEIGSAYAQLRVEAQKLGIDLS
jgi:hypothetical protein